jgi:hypothetical protein
MPVTHYNSKCDSEELIGVIDSAALCVMLIHVTAGIEDTVRTEKYRTVPDGFKEIRGIHAILMDGEEAFKDWTNEDSLHGVMYGIAQI